MFGLFGKKSTHKDIAWRLYEALNIQARQDAFYTSYGVADTTDGRFDLICLHSFLIINRLQKEGKDGARVSQALFDVMFKQFERALREMGVGDLSVPRHVKRMMAAFKGRYYAYEQALQAQDDAMLAEAIRRNVFGPDEKVDALVLADMAEYMRKNHIHIDSMSYESFIEGQALFVHDLPEGAARDDKSNNTRMVA